jgi:hypothetical protein
VSSAIDKARHIYQCAVLNMKKALGASEKALQKNGRHEARGVGWSQCQAMKKANTVLFEE